MARSTPILRPLLCLSLLALALASAPIQPAAAVLSNGSILAVDLSAGTGGKGELLSVNPSPVRGRS